MLKTLNSGEGKAQKNHLCNFCEENISPGEKYDYQKNRDDCGIYEWKTHKVCSFVATALDMYETYADYDGVNNDHFMEAIYEYFETNELDDSELSSLEMVELIASRLSPTQEGESDE